MENNKRLTKLEVNALRDKGLLTETFHHVSFGIFNITKLRLAIQSNLKLFPVMRAKFSDLRAEGQNLGPEEVVQWLVSQREIDEERIKALTPEELEDPIIYLFDEDMNAYPIDGIHRLMGRFRRGDADFGFYAIPLEAAKDFLVPNWVTALDVPWGSKDIIGDKFITKGDRK